METTRPQTILNIQRQYAPFYNIGGGITLILVGVWIGSLIFRTGYYTNVYTEALSVIATIAVLDRLNDWRDVRSLKQRLRREAGSRDNSTALNAVDWLRAERWLIIDDGECLLSEQKCSRANLEDAFLYEADLSKSIMYKVNLRNADISKANLQSAYLHRADLTGASVFETDFRGAVLAQANLRDVRHIKQAIFDETTALPDARPLRDVHGEVIVDDNDHILYDGYWTPDTDMTRFTNSEHRDFYDIGE